MRQKIVAGNWKMNTNIVEGKALAAALVARAQEIPQDVTLIVAPPFTHLSEVAAQIENTHIALSAQNCAAKAQGAYTGEVSAAMLQSIPCKYVILGHSERREYYGETNAILKEKLQQALQAGLLPIFCVGERLEERESGKHFEVIASQLKETVSLLGAEDFAKVVIAYEPVWAIGTGKTATAEQAQEVHAFIRKVLSESFGIQAVQTPILYGGSCKPSNAEEILAQADVDGGLIGGAALQADDFLSIAKALRFAPRG